MTPPRDRIKRALVTGGTRGIGAAIARELLKHGYRVTVTGRASAGHGPKGCAYLGCDFADGAAVEALAARLARSAWSVLVNNTGINIIGPSEAYALPDWLAIQQVNVTAPWRCCQALLPGMRRRRFGRIVNITSVFGVVSKAGRAAYSASKFGLFGMSRALALEVAADNVLVNCVAPGFVDTELTRRILGRSGIAKMVVSIPAGRLAKPAEIAVWVRMLASDANTYLTGQQIVVDGGFTSA